MMKVIFLILMLSINGALMSQKTKGRNIALEKTNPEEVKRKLEQYKKDPNQSEKTIAEEKMLDTTKKISAFGQSSRRERKKLETTTAIKTSAPTTKSTNNALDSVSTASVSLNKNIISNTSAIANGQAASSAATPVARELKYKASEASVDYFKQLREKFEAEEKIRKDKEAKEAAEKAQREEAAKDARHLKEDQAPQFDKYRNGAKNEPVVKTTPEEDYKKLFK